MPKNQAVRAPCGPHGPTSASVLLLQGPQVFSPQDPGLVGTWVPPDVAAPHREGSRHLCTAWPRPDAFKLYIFLLLTEWTLHTLAQDSAGWCGCGRVSHVDLEPPEGDPAAGALAGRCTQASPGPCGPAPPVTFTRGVVSLSFFNLSSFSLLLCGFGWVFIAVVVCFARSGATYVFCHPRGPVAKTHLCSGGSRRLASSLCSETLPGAGLAGYRLAFHNMCVCGGVCLYTHIHICFFF